MVWTWCITSRPAIERTGELIEVVVIVSGEASDPVGDGQAATGEMYASPLPVGRRERAQQRQDLAPAPPERSQCLARIVAEVLSLLRPSSGVERVADRPADAPGLEIARARGEHENAWLIER